MPATTDQVSPAPACFLQATGRSSLQAVWPGWMMPGSGGADSWPGTTTSTGTAVSSQRHDGRDVDILQARHRLYQTACSQTPSRWSGNTRNWQPITKVTLNPERDSVAQAATNPRDNGQVAA